MKHQHRTLALTLAAVLAQTGASDAASSITEAQWNAFAAGNAESRCFAAFVPTLSRNFYGSSIPATSSVSVGDVAFKKLDFGADLDKPFATKVRSTNPASSQETLTVERDGDMVSFLLELPGGTTRGFVESGGAPAPIATGAATSVERTLHNIPSAALHSSAPVRCGLTLVAIRNKALMADEGFLAIILRAGKVVGFEESEAG